MSNFLKNKKSLIAISLLAAALLGALWQTQKRGMFLISVLDDKNEEQTAEDKRYDEIISKYVIAKNFDGLQKLGENIYLLQTNASDNENNGATKFDIKKAQKQTIHEQPDSLIARLIFNKTIDPASVKIETLRITENGSSTAVGTSTAVADAAAEDGSSTAGTSSPAIQPAAGTSSPANNERHGTSSPGRAASWLDAKNLLADALVPDNANPPAQQEQNPVAPQQSQTPEPNLPAQEGTSSQPAPENPSAPQIGTSTAPGGTSTTPIGTSTPAVGTSTPDVGTSTPTAGSSTPAGTSTASVGTSTPAEPAASPPPALSPLPKLIIIADNELIAEFQTQNQNAALKISSLKARLDGDIFNKDNVEPADAGIFYPDAQNATGTTTAAEDENARAAAAELIEDLTQIPYKRAKETVAYSPEEKTQNSRRKSAKEKRLLNRTEFLTKYRANYIYQPWLKEVGENVYTASPRFLEPIAAEETLDTGTTTSFSVLDTDAQFIQDINLYYVDLIFSKPISAKNTENLAAPSFNVENFEKQTFTPDAVFLLNNAQEALLIFRNSQDLKAQILKLANIKSEDAADPPLDGYVLITENDTDYISLTTTIDNRYDAYVGADITFQATKLTFGKFSKYTDSNSTIAIDAINGASADPKCAILVFGNNMSLENGTDTIAISGLNIVPKPTGQLPIPATIVQTLEQQKDKRFMGFTYMGQMELVDGNPRMYLNLAVPKNHTEGKYNSTLSIELFCPGG